MIHLTAPEKVDAILVEGLRVNMDLDLTADVPWALHWYGLNPVFVAEPESEFIQVTLEYSDKEYATIEVETDGLSLVADLVSLIDKGGRLQPAYNRICWARGREPEELRGVLDRNNALKIPDLLKPDSRF
jgi:hypothetical protein